MLRNSSKVLWQRCAICICVTFLAGPTFILTLNLLTTATLVGIFSFITIIVFGFSSFMSNCSSQLFIHQYRVFGSGLKTVFTSTILAILRFSNQFSNILFPGGFAWPNESCCGSYGRQRGSIFSGLLVVILCYRWPHIMLTRYTYGFAFLLCKVEKPLLMHLEAFLTSLYSWPLDAACLLLSLQIFLVAELTSLVWKVFAALVPERLRLSFQQLQIIIRSLIS